MGRESRVRGSREFKAYLDYIRPCLKRKKKRCAMYVYKLPTINVTIKHCKHILIKKGKNYLVEVVISKLCKLDTVASASYLGVWARKTASSKPA